MRPFAFQPAVSCVNSSPVSICVTSANPDSPHARVCQAALAAYSEPEFGPTVWLCDETPFHERLNRYLQDLHARQIPLAVWLQDDAIIEPDTLALLLGDRADAENDGWRPALVSARSNRVAGAQNIRFTQIGELEGLQWVDEYYWDTTDWLFPVCTLIDVAAWLQVGGLESDRWFADNHLSWKLRQAGWALVVSRAYVHHYGSQSLASNPSEQAQAGLDWLLAREPACAAELGFTPPPE